jgi:hypothetical protein
MFEIYEKDVKEVLDRNGLLHEPGDAEDEEVAEAILEDLDRDLVAVVACKSSTDMDEQTDAAWDEIERQLVQQRHPGLFCICSICHQPCLLRTVHLHRDEYIGDVCCWDDRLKASE